MILAVAATEFELNPCLTLLPEKEVYQSLLCGVGLVESTYRMTRHLEESGENISLVINFGVAGGFIRDHGKSLNVLDICLVEQEILGDFGVQFPLRYDSLLPDLCTTRFSLDEQVRQKAEKYLLKTEFSFVVGNSITVNSVSGTRQRGEIFIKQFDGHCENMEGAAIARVCEAYSIPLVEIRCISNYVEDRDTDKWQMKQACSKVGQVAAFLIEKFGEEYGVA